MDSNSSIMEDVRGILESAVHVAAQVMDPANEERFRRITHEEFIRIDGISGTFKEVSESLRVHYIENCKARPDFDNDLRRVMVNALAQLLETIKFVITGPTTATGWQANTKKIKELIGGVRESFESATKLVQTDLKNIAKHSQDAADAEQKMTVFIGSLNEHRASLDIKVKNTELERNKIEEDIKFLYDHLEPNTREVTDWYLFIPVKKLVINEKHYEQRAEINRRKTESLALDSYRALYERSGFETLQFISLSKMLLVEVCQDENRLIDLKSSVQEALVDVGYIENYVQSPRINFGRLHFIRCVLELLRSDHMEKVEGQVGSELSQKKQDIISECQSGLSAKDWEEAQHPYKRVDDDDISSFSMGRSGIYDIPPSPLLNLTRQVVVAT